MSAHSQQSSEERIAGLERANERLSSALTHVINRVSTERRDDEHGHIFLVGYEALRWAERDLRPALAEAGRERCHRCDLDMHRCPGCGVPVDHGVVACEDCANALTGKQSSDG